MANLIPPDSNFYIGAVRTGIDPFQQLAVGIDDRDWEFATCGMVMTEVCRGQRDPNLLRRYCERFAVVIFIPTTNQIWENAEQLGWSLDHQGRVLPAPDVLIAACALAADATVLTTDPHDQGIPGLRVLDRPE